MSALVSPVNEPFCLLFFVERVMIQLTLLPIGLSPTKAERGL